MIASMLVRSYCQTADVEQSLWLENPAIFYSQRC